MASHHVWSPATGHFFPGKLSWGCKGNENRLQNKMKTRQKTSGHRHLPAPLAEYLFLFFLLCSVRRTIFSQWCSRTGILMQSSLQKVIQLSNSSLLSFLYFKWNIPFPPSRHDRLYLTQSFFLTSRKTSLLSLMVFSQSIRLIFLSNLLPFHFSIYNYSISLLLSFKHLFSFT